MYVNNIRSPNNIFIRWFLFGLILNILFLQSVEASAVETNVILPASYSVEGITLDKLNDKINEIDSDSNYNYFIVKYSALLKGYKYPSWTYVVYYTKDSIFIDDTGYSSNEYFSFYECVDCDQSTGECYSLFSGDGKSGNIKVNSDTDFLNTSFASAEKSVFNSGDTLAKFSRQLVGYKINNYVENSINISKFSTAEYDINDLKKYPLNTINVTSPITGSDVKTNGRFVNVAIKGKIGIDCTDDIAVTKEDLGKLIRNNFRYSFKSDKENFENVSYLGPVIETSRGESPGDDILDILQVLGNDYPIVKGEQIKIAPLNYNFTIGVSGNAKDWTSKKYYNFVINTALYVGENDGEYDYKLYFKVPVGFGMNITYKTIIVNYSLSRGSYVDDDFDGIDDNTNEIIPSEEIEIINPSTSTPSLPSDDGLDDGLQVVNILKDIYKDFCHGVNGSVNILKSFFSVISSTVKSVCDYSQQMVISFSNIFGFMPSPIPQLITMSLAIMIFVSVLGFIKK